MQNRYDAIIAGAGPAGLFCAINASSRGGRILVLEKNRSAGKKLLLSGSGQCNFTHTGSIPEFIRHYGDAANFVKPPLSAFTNTQLINFFESNGVPAAAREDGKVFPAGMKAGDILSLLLQLCRKNSVEIRYSSPVQSVTRSGTEFTIHSGGELYTSPVLVIAAGGSSYPATGSDGSGFALAASLGHTIIETTPALAPVYMENYTMAELSGISVCRSRIDLFREGKKFRSGTGDILFTPKGISGPGILDLSRWIKNGDTISISLTESTPQEVESALAENLRSEGKKSVRNILKIFDIPERLIDAVLTRCNIDPAKKGAEISRSERIALKENICSLKFTVKEKGDFRVAMATAGGVSREEIDRRTMESKIVRDLYFAGEVIDVDGDTGGYNIQWAFSSGKAAGDAIPEKLSGE